VAQEFEIRLATPDDELQVSDLFALCYPQLMARSYRPDVLAAALPKMIRANPALLRSGRFYVATSTKGKIVGCGGWTAERPGTGETIIGRAHIRHFATHPAWLRCGIGRALYSSCEQAAVSAVASEFECLASLNARDFYHSLGFIAVHEVSVPMGDAVTFPAILMKQKLRD
jgi:N-acetylglutamate synthase-like GNAT family acetyltransferase